MYCSEPDTVTPDNTSISQFHYKTKSLKHLLQGCYSPVVNAIFSLFLTKGKCYYTRFQWSTQSVSH